MLGENIENKNMQEGKAFNTSAFSDAKNRLRQIANNKIIAKQSATDESMNNLSAGAEELDRQAYQTNNDALTKQYQKQAQLAKAAYMIKYAAGRAGEDWSDLNNVSDIMNRYLQNVQGDPSKGQAVAKFINSDEDAEEFGIRMGWIESDEDDNINLIDSFVNDVRDTLKAPAEIFGQGVSDLLGWAEQQTGAEGASKVRALNEFAYQRFGKYIGDMTEDEILKLELLLQLQNVDNGSVIDSQGARVAGDGTSAYQDEIDRQRLDVGAEEIGLGAGLSAAELAYSIPTALFSIAGNFPITEDLINAYMGLGYNIGNLTTLIPGFDDYVAGLPKDLQENYKNIGGNLILSLITHHTGKYATTKKVNGKRTWREPIKKILNSIDSNAFIQKVKSEYNRLNPVVNNDLMNNAWTKFKNYSQIYGDNMTSLLNGEGLKAGSRFVSDAMNNAGRVKDERIAERGIKKDEKSLKNEVLGNEEIENKMLEQAGKTINPKYTYQNKQAADAYSNLDIEELRGATDFKSLITLLRNSIKGKAATQDAILDTIGNRYGMGTEYREPLEGRGEFSDIPSYTVKNWFKTMLDHSKFLRDKNILNIMSKVANKNKLTPKDLKMMARALDKQFDLWKDGKTEQQIKEGYAEKEATRQELNAIIRREVDGIQEFKEAGIGNVLEFLDKQQSPQIATVRKLIELNNKVNQLKSAIPDKTTLNKVGTLLGKFSSKTKAANTIIDKMGGVEYMDALLREKNLNKALNKFADLLEKVKKEPDKAEKVINEWLKDKNNKEVVENYGGFVEGEVIEPDFTPERSPNEYLEELLESVEIEQPENFMLGEDAKYNGQEGVDYTTPTRVTPEGYPGRYGATSESYKGKPAGDFGTPAEFETKAEPKAEVNQPITSEDYALKYGMPLDAFKAQLEKAGLKKELIDSFISKLEKKNFKVGGKQGTLFDVPAEAETKSTKSKKTGKKSDKK